jgi:hypothetical protein
MTHKQATRYHGCPYPRQTSWARTPAAPSPARHVEVLSTTPLPTHSWLFCMHCRVHNAVATGSEVGWPVSEACVDERPFRLNLPIYGTNSRTEHIFAMNRCSFRSCPSKQVHNISLFPSDKIIFIGCIWRWRGGYRCPLEEHRLYHVQMRLIKLAIWSYHNNQYDLFTQQ